MSEEITLEKVQELVTRAPFHKWLGLKVVAVQDDGIELTATWREEWVVNPDRRYTHGGVIAALVDLGADWAMVKKTGRGVPTIDLRVDYHSAAMPGDLTVRGRVVRMGSQLSTALAISSCCSWRIEALTTFMGCSQVPTGWTTRALRQSR